MLQAGDAGQYRCEVAVQGKDRPQLSHTVRIIGECLLICQRKYLNFISAAPPTLRANHSLLIKQRDCSLYLPCVAAQSGQPPQSGPGAQSAVLTAGSSTPAAAFLTLLLAGLVWL